MAEQETASSWRRFWERGGWWRSVLVVVGYSVLYQGSGILFAALLASTHDPALTILRELFGPQPIRGAWWMWIAVAVVLLVNVLHFAAIDYGKAGAGVVVAWLASGLFIGFAEETLTRGYVVNLMRKAGYRAIVVAIVSATLFAVLHLGNLLSGQSLFATLTQVLYTFAFG